MTSRNQQLAKRDGPEHYSSNSSAILRATANANYPKAKGGFAYVSLYEQSGRINVGLIMFNIE
jgi:hypothetical protein